METTKLEAVRTALGSVVDPTFDRTLAELGTLEDVTVEEHGAHARVRVSTASDELRARMIEAMTIAAKNQGIDKLDVDWNLQVPTRQVMGDDPMPDVRNLVLVMAGKGGVGKSSCAANIAMGLARGGARVGLLDADIYGPSIPTMFGIHGHPFATDDKKIAPLERFGLKLMSIGFLMEDPRAAIVWRGPMLHGALQQFLKDVHWGKLDYLLLDMPPGTGDVALTLAQRARITGAVIVTTPQEVALQDVYKAVSMCGKLNVPILGVVENMSYFIDTAGVKHHLFGEGGGQKIADFAKAPLLGSVPIDPLLRQWADDGTPVIQAAPTSPSALAFAQISDAIATRIAKEHFDRGGGVKSPAADGPTRLKIIR